VKEVTKMANIGLVNKAVFDKKMGVEKIKEAYSNTGRWLKKHGKDIICNSLLTLFLGGICFGAVSMLCPKIYYKKATTESYVLDNKNVTMTRYGVNLDGYGWDGSFVKLDIHNADGSVYSVRKSNGCQGNYGYDIKRDSFRFQGRDEDHIQFYEQKVIMPNGKVEKRKEVVEEIVNKELGAAKDSVNKYVKLAKEKELSEIGVVQARENLERAVNNAGAK
jgi:hypothetical protein